MMIPKKDRWTRNELRLKNGYYDLAQEVLRQWHLDGQPLCDQEGISLWHQLLVAYKKLHEPVCYKVTL